MYHRFGERLLDLAITIPTPILLSPVLALVALLVRGKLASPFCFVSGARACTGDLPRYTSSVP